MPILRLLALFPAMLALPVAALAQQAGAPSRPALSAENRAAVRCSAAFAIVAGEQERGAAGVAAYPPLAWRGREYMVATGEALIAAGWTQAQVSAAMNEAAAAIQHEAVAKGDAEGVLGAIMPPCLSLLDAQVPPLTLPNLPQCAAILRLSYDEVHAAEGLTDRAKDLLTLASVLESRARRELAGQGRSDAEADAVLDIERDSVTKVAAQPGGVQRYDIATCFELAKPEEKKHY